MQRFFLEQKLKAGEVVKMPQDIARQISAVLRMRAGEKIILFDGSGYDFTAELEAVNKNNCSACVVSKTTNDKEPKRRIILFQSIIKKDKFEWVVEKCTEVGVSEVVPILSARSVKTGLNRTRLERIAREAAEQSGRAIVPVLHGAMDFGGALRFASEHCQKNFLAHEKASAGECRCPENVFEAGIFIGPEGGWTEEEAVRARTAGLRLISLGKTILRSETAAVCASYMLTK